MCSRFRMRSRQTVVSHTRGPGRGRATRPRPTRLRSNDWKPMTFCCGASITITVSRPRIARPVSTCSAARSNGIRAMPSPTRGSLVVWGKQWSLNWTSTPSSSINAQAAAERGLELDENESECHRVLAQVFLTRGDLRRSLQHQERALFLNPNDDRSVCSMGEILTFAGRAEEAEEWVRRSVRLNPYHPQRYWTHLARALFHLQSF